MTPFARCLRATAVSCLAILSTASCSHVEEEQEMWNGEEEVIAANPLTGDMAEGSHLMTTNALNLRAGPGVEFENLVTIPEGATVTVLRAGPENGFYNVSYTNVMGWASGKYLQGPGATAWPSDPMAPPPAPGEIKPVKISGPAVRAHVQNFTNAACAAVGCPHQIGTYGGHQPTADRAIDMMQTPGGVRPSDGGAHGTRVADFALANAAAYRIDYVIWQQRINMADGRGWKGMADRGSITQNHYDHVHVSFDP